MAMLDAVYVDTVEEKSVVAIWPKPAFRPIFEVATTREGSGIALINQTPQTQDEPEASGSCSWWRRGRVGLPIPQLLTGHDRGEKRSVGRFGFDAHELVTVDGDAVEHLPNQFLPLLVGHPGVRPQDVAVNHSGTVYVADTNNTRIQKFTFSE